MIERSTEMCNMRGIMQHVCDLISFSCLKVFSFFDLAIYSSLFRECLDKVHMCGYVLEMVTAKAKRDLGRNFCGVGNRTCTKLEPDWSVGMAVRAKVR